MIIDRNKSLGEVLHTHKLHHIEKFVEIVKAKRDDIEKDKVYTRGIFRRD